jgi:chorismate dehydratase
MSDSLHSSRSHGEKGVPLRVGAVSYLNTKPLVYDLDAQNDHLQLFLDLPSRLADKLRAGDYDVALIPSIEYFQNPNYRIVSDACIGCHGPVMSVKVVFRRSPDSIRTLGVDEGSRTSAALARILLDEQFGIRPELVPFPIGSDLKDVEADAVLIIGDRAMHLPKADYHDVWDLGEEWVRWSGLPFVFAMWVARPEIPLAQLETALSRSRDQGLANLESIVEEEAPRYDLEPKACQRYLAEHLHFVLGERERAGLELFRRHAARLGVTPARWVEGTTGDIRFVESPAP